MLKTFFACMLIISACSAPIAAAGRSPARKSEKKASAPAKKPGKTDKNVPRGDIPKPAAKHSGGAKKRALPDMKKQAERFARLQAMAGETEAKNPDADALILEDDGEYVLNADGTWLFRYHFAGKLLKESAVAGWQSFSEPLDEGHDKVAVLEATVYRPTGKILPFEEENLHYQKHQTEDGIFANDRTLSYSFPELSAGSIIEYTTERETYNPFRKDFFFPQWTFQSGQPARESSLKISAPKNAGFHYSTVHFADKTAANPKITEAGGREIYFWQLKNLPAITDAETQMPPPEDLSPQVKGALFADWNAVNKWFYGLYKERIAATTPEIKSAAREITKNAKTQREQTAALYHYIQSNIRYVALKLSAASTWGGYPAKTTWQKRYGCCIDKTILFCAMLKTIGIEASPVILDVNTSPEHDFSLPDIDFEHAITRVTLDGAPVYLDPTGYDYRFPSMPAADYSVQALDVFERKVVRIPPPPDAINYSRYDYKIALSTGGSASAELSAAYSGPREGELRAYYRPLDKTKREEIFSNWLGDISPEAKLTAYSVGDTEDLASPFRLALRYELNDYLIKAGDLRILELPDFEMVFPEAARKERKYPIAYSVPLNKIYRYEITLPPQYETIAINELEHMTNPYGSFSLKCEHGGGSITCDAKLSLSATRIPPEDYPKYKAFLDKISRLTKERIFLRERI